MKNNTLFVSRDRICACVITYNPQLNILSRLLDTLSEIGIIYIVDNGSQNVSKIKDWLHLKHQRAVLIANLENLGIAKAINIGIQQAINDKQKWFFIFDQDSFCSPQYVEKTFDAIANADLTSLDQFGLCCPTIYDAEVTKATQNSFIFKHLIGRKNKRLMPVTSGSLIYLPNIAKYGMMDEDLFIDAVDFEYNFRIYKNNGIIIKSQAILNHNLGKPESRKFLGLTFVFSGHSPLRYYYISRNRWLVFYKYKELALFWFVKSIISAIYAYVSIMLICNNRDQYTKAIFMGTFDGIRKKIRTHQDLICRFK